jgi:hypothetical protein
MKMSVSNGISSAALPIARVVLRILVIANWVYGAALIGLIVISIVEKPWLIQAFQLEQYPDPEGVLMALRAIVVIGLITIPLNHIILTRLLAIVETVRMGDPFIGANATRLQAIAWVMLTLNVLSIVIGAIAASVSTKSHPIQMDAGFSLNGFLAVLMTFVLARVFAVGSSMREDLEGTV